MAPPKGIADNRNGAAIAPGGMIVCVCEYTPSFRRNTKRAKVGPGCELAVDKRRSVAGIQLEVSICPGRHRCEHLITCFERLEHRVTQEWIRTLGKFQKHVSQLLRMRNGQRPKQESIDEAEDGGISADAEC
ncbi:MAG TPA: hypothetical protein VF283_01985 [Bryobacteraceae bacterium]